MRRASMGPRLFSRGKCGESVISPSLDQLQWGRGCSAAESAIPGPEEPRLGRASMGPRLFSRGKRRLVHRSCRHPGLQWGRGCSAAESFQAPSGPRPAGLLQWGRGCSAAESGLGWQTGHPTPGSFNGAAAVQPRKAVPSTFGPLRRTCFNGAAAVQPRKGAGRVTRAELRRASMGPRLFSRGKEETNQATAP